MQEGVRRYSVHLQFGVDECVLIPSKKYVDFERLNLNGNYELW